ncbi:MAG: hypothetical protein K6C08_00540 [Oscillospiraceae bacterium]|nr:hypothetical protein [Oscillospiraceae bacterium]
MLTCKLCRTQLGKAHLRRDGSMQCPNCLQIYWKAAVERAVDEENTRYRAEAPRHIRRKAVA